MFIYKDIDAKALEYKSDKSSAVHGYTKYYDFYFSNIKNASDILEIGVLNGYSLKIWRDYFTSAVIHGVDFSEECKKCEEERIKIHIGNQADADFMSSIAKDKKFDAIIDDGSHLSPDQIKTFEIMFQRLKPGGIYVIEDTKISYHKKWSWWIDEKDSCVNYFKSRADDVSMHGGYVKCSDRTKILKKRNRLTDFEKTIESVHFYSGIIFVFKQGDIS